MYYKFHIGLGEPILQAVRQSTNMYTLEEPLGIR